MLRVHRLERKWDHFTGMYREIVASLAGEIETRSGFRTIAIEDPPLAFPFIADAVLLEARLGAGTAAPGAPQAPGGTAGILQRPPYDIVEVSGGPEAAAEHRPCLYVQYTGDYPKVMRIEQLE
jgi:hypothetical protein